MSMSLASGVKKFGNFKGPLLIFSYSCSLEVIIHLNVYLLIVGVIWRYANEHLI
jgi:hypothetical protein